MNIHSSALKTHAAAILLMAASIEDFPERLGRSLLQNPVGIQGKRTPPKLDLRTHPVLLLLFTCRQPRLQLPP
jgi:hypothetical protein